MNIITIESEWVFCVKNGKIDMSESMEQFGRRQFKIR